MGKRAWHSWKTTAFCGEWTTACGWEGGFENNPRGLVEQFTDEDKSQLEEIRDTARRLTEPLQQLADQLGESCDGEQFARPLYEFLLSTGAKQRLEEGADLLELPPEEVDAEQLRTLRLNQGGWEVLVELLDVFCHVLEKIPLPLAKLRELFVNAAQKQRHRLDSQHVGPGVGGQCRPYAPAKSARLSGTRDRIRGNFRLSFPKTECFRKPSVTACCKSASSSTLRSSNSTTMKNIICMRRWLHRAVIPAGQLPSGKNSTGKRRPDSPAVQALLRIFPDCELSCQQLPEPFYIANDQTAFESFCRSLRERAHR